MKTKCLCLLLCVLTLFSSAALAAPGDAQFYSDSSDGEALTGWQGGALVLTSKGLERIGADGSSALLFPAPKELGGGYDALIYGDGTTLYALDKTTGALYTWDLTTGGLTLLCQLDWDGLGMTMDGYTFAAEVSSLLVADGSATLLLTGDDYLTASLLRFDLATGARTATGVKRLVSVTPYQDGKLLGSTYDPYAAEGSRSRLMVIDPTAGRAEDVGPLPDNAAGLIYDAANGYFYCLSASELHRGRVGEMTECVAYIPSNAPYVSLTSADRQPQTAILEGGLFASLDYGVLTVRNADPQYKPSRTLRISGGSSDSAYRAFVREHPEVPVLFTPVLSSADDVMRAMVGGDGADLYVLPVSSSLYAPLIEKGYLADLTQNETVRSLVERMYPALAEGLMQDGKIYAMPSTIYAQTLGYSPYVLEQLGLTEDDLPKTLPEFLEFVGRWDDEFAEEHPSLSLFTDTLDMSEAKLLFFDRMLSQYEAMLRLRGEEITFDTPLFRELLAALESANLPELAESIFDVTSGVSRSYTIFDDSAKPTALFDFYYSAYLMDYNLDQGYKPLLLPLAEDAPALLEAYMEVYVVNASSKNADLALSYLETVAGNLGDGLERTLLPDVNDPVENPNMLENIREGEASLKEAEERGDEESAAVLREQLAYTRKYRYAISPEDIEAYRSIADKLTLSPVSAIGSDYAQDLLKRYLTGQIDADGFIRQLQQKLRMAQLEQIG